MAAEVLLSNGIHLGQGLHQTSIDAIPTTGLGKEQPAWLRGRWLRSALGNGHLRKSVEGDGLE